MADSILNIAVAVHEAPADVTERALRTTGDENSLDGLQRIVRYLGGLPARTAKVTARVDSVTRGTASQTVAITAASCTAGDKLHFYIPGRPRLSCTAVATTAEVTAAPNTGLFSLQTATDTAVAQSLRDAIKAHPGLRDFVTATESSGTVTIATVEGGTWGNAIQIQKDVTTAGAMTLGASTLAGGDDVLSKPTTVLTFGSANITAGDLLSIGARVYTWAASASADGEITLSATEATAAANFVTAFNADATWTGLGTADRSNAVVTITWDCEPRLAQHLIAIVTETNSGSIVPSNDITGGSYSTGKPTIGQTVTGSSTTRVHGRMGIT